MTFLAALALLWLEVFVVVIWVWMLVKYKEEK